MLVFNEVKLHELYNDALNLFRQKEYDAALQVLDVLQNYTADWLRAYLLRAYILRDSGCPVSEMNVLRQLLELSEKRKTTLADGEIQVVAEAWSMLGEVCTKLGECEIALEAFLQSSRWELRGEKKLEEYSNAIFAANYCNKISDKRWLELYAGYRELLTQVYGDDIAMVQRGTRYQHSKIRVGYLSGDLRSHPVAWFLRPLVEHHCKEKFQVYLYQINGVRDNITADLCSWADKVRNVAQADVQKIAAQVRSDEIDILVDLSGHTKDNRLPVLAFQPAPILLSGIGYFNSTGLFIDGFLSDTYCSPMAQHSAYTEPMVQLPATHFCYQPWRELPEVGGKMAWEKKGYLTFGCFNNFSKVTDEMLILWRDILLSVPESRLRLKHKLFDTQEGRDWTIKRLERLKLPLERIEFSGFSTDYLQEYGEIDIALDTYPYVGGLTSCEALMMGVPVVSLYGSRHGTRFGLSFLCNLGMEELASDNGRDYVAKAVALALDKDLLKLLHGQLRNKMIESPLMDGKAYCESVERIYEAICDLHCSE